jgi:hypothetical protein
MMPHFAPALGIAYAIAHPMKNSSATENFSPTDSSLPKTRGSECPLKICIVFDDETSARSAEILIKHAAVHFPYDTQLLSFDELDPSEPSQDAARSAAAADILVVALRDDRALPEHVKFWLGLFLGLRKQNLDGALVVLITKSDQSADPDSSLLEYLETVAAIGGLSFIPPQRKNGRAASAACISSVRRLQSRLGSNLRAHGPGPALRNLAGRDR